MNKAVLPNMNCVFRKFYDAGASENAGGADSADNESDVIVDEKNDASEQETKEPEATQEKEIPSQILSDEELKSYGFDSAEHLKTFLAEQKANNIPDEEKKERDNIEKANFLKFSTENKLLNVDEFNQYENLRNKADKDLVFENFKTGFKEDHPEITDEQELEEAAKEDFDYEYKLKSESESVRKRAEAKLAKEAQQLRSPYESKVTIAKEQFKTEQSLRAVYPKFETFVQGLITKNTPEKTVLFKAKDGESEIPIEIEITAKDREAMAKDFKTPKSFQKYIEGKPEEVETSLTKKMQNWIKLNKADEIAEKSFEAGRGIGIKNGSNVGAENPFALKQGAQATKEAEETLEESNRRIGEARRKYTQGR